MGREVPFIVFVLSLILCLSPVYSWQHIIVDNYSSYPALAKFEDRYILIYTKYTKDGVNLFLRYSYDGFNWSDPVRITKFRGTDYQPYLLVDKYNTCWLVFTRKEENDVDYDIYLMKSEDCMNWSDPQPFIATHTHDWYPYIYQDSKGTYWMFFARNVFNEKGEITSAIFYSSSRDGIKWTEIKQITKAMGTVFPRMVEKEGKYFLFFSAFTGSWKDFARLNEHNLFEMVSNDGLSWSKAAKISEIPKGKFVLYLDAKLDENGTIWIAYTSDAVVNEEVYIFASKDGIRWSPPERITRNAEYIQSLENPFNFKCDQKALLIDRDKFIIAYSSAIYPTSPLFVAVGKPQIKDFSYIKAEFNVDMSPPQRKENVEVTEMNISKKGEEIFENTSKEQRKPSKEKYGYIDILLISALIGAGIMFIVRRKRRL